MNPSRLRLLGNRYSRVSLWLHPILAKLGPPIDPRDVNDQTADCDGLVVLDDCMDSESVEAAMALRRTRPDLEIAVVKLMDRDWSDAECFTRILSERDPSDNRRARIGEQKLSALMGLGQSSLDVQIDPEAIKFEYQG